MISNWIVSRLVSTCEFIVFITVILAHVAFSVFVFLPAWLPFLLATRLAKVAVSHVPRIARDYKWMSSSDALFFLPCMNETNDEGRVVNRPYIHLTATIGGGRLDVDEVFRKLASYLRANGGGAVVGTVAGDEVMAGVADCEQISEDTKKIYEKLLYYPVSRFGYFFWKRDRSFDINYHLPMILRFEF